MSSRNVDILVLGGSKSGKTCFMLAMYDDMRHGYGAFTFSAVDPDVDRDLVSRFEIMRDSKGEERWAAPTSQITTYELDLNYAFRRFLTFNWRDYRGGIIQEAASKKDEENFATLVDAAQVVMICAPGDLLYDAGIRGNRKALNALLGPDIGRLLTKEGGVRPPIVLLVTKADLFYAAAEREKGAATQKEWNELLVDASAEAYHTLMAEDGGLRVFICPVTLGLELAGDQDYGAIEPEYVHLPMMFAYLEYARTTEARWRRKIAEQEARLEELTTMVWAPKRIAAATESLTEAQQLAEEVSSRISVALKSFPPEENVLFFVNGKRANLR